MDYATNYWGQLNPQERIILADTPRILREDAARKLISQRAARRAAATKVAKIATEVLRKQHIAGDVPSMAVRTFGRPKLSLVRQDGDVYLRFEIPALFMIEGGKRAGSLSLVCKLDQAPALEVPSDSELSGVESGDTSPVVSSWWQRAKAKIKEILAKVIASPITGLLAGMSLYLSNWGLVFASAYVGARAAVAVLR